MEAKQIVVPQSSHSKEMVTSSHLDTFRIDLVLLCPERVLLPTSKRVVKVTPRRLFFALARNFSPDPVHLPKYCRVAKAEDPPKTIFTTFVGLFGRKAGPDEEVKNKSATEEHESVATVYCKLNIDDGTQMLCRKMVGNAHTGRQTRNWRNKL